MTYIVCLRSQLCPGLNLGKARFSGLPSHQVWKRLLCQAPRKKSLLEAVFIKRVITECRSFSRDILRGAVAV